MTEDKACRDQFESHVMQTMGDSASLLFYRKDVPGKLRDGEYVNKHLQRYWLGWQACWSRAAKPAAPEGFVLMPKALTADNGAKAALIGEFHEVIEVTCPECDGACEDCDHCQESGTVTQQVTVGWDTIKAIYCKAVDLFATPTPPAAPKEPTK